MKLMHIYTYQPREVNAAGRRRACSPIPEDTMSKVMVKRLPFLDSVIGSQYSIDAIDRYEVQIVIRRRR